MRQTDSGTGARSISFDADDFPLLPKLGGISINTIVMGHATAASNVVVTISNDAGIVCSVSSIGGPMWLADLRLFVPLANRGDSVVIATAGEAALITLMVEAGAISGG